MSYVCLFERADETGAANSPIAVDPVSAANLVIKNDVIFKV